MALSRIALITLWLAASLWPISSAASSNNRCRCLYGQPCWPNDEAFSKLSQNLSQPLIHPVPAAAACYTNASSSGCSEVSTNFPNSTWRSDHPGAYQNINWEIYIETNGTIDACYLNTTLGATCQQGSIPPIGVDARTPQDVQAAVRFARDNNLRLVVKNTGHDYLGRSAGRGAFMIWTHHMKDLSYNDTFTPEGASSDTKASNGK